jgi:DNA-binding NarL/FixJ family response regulator
MTESGRSHEDDAFDRYAHADYDGAIAGYERAYAAYRSRGDALGAGRAARTLAWLHGNVHGDDALANGWASRARSLLETAGPDSAERGWVELLLAESEADDETRQARFRAAVELARRHGDTALEFEALGWVGIELVFAGRVDEGMAMLDEALAAVCAGEVHDLAVTEGLFCGMFWACERVHDVSRAEQWLRAAEDVARQLHLVGVSAFCRAHYGAILTAAGRWPEAETELLNAARLFESGYAAKRANALIRLADLRVRQGRYEDAEQLLEGHDQHPDAVRAIAALHLGRGELTLALDVLERGLADLGLHAGVAGPLLALLVDVQLARDEVDEAAAAATRLAEVAAGQPSDYLQAAAALARGKVCVATTEGDYRACMHEALASFSRAQMPIELARARLELARAVASERPEVAIAEAASALEAFERAQAERDVDEAAAMLRALGGAARTGPKTRATLTKRETQVLDLLGHGLPNPEIADRLYISRKTVEHHVGRILAKLGLRSRSEAAAYAARAGLGESAQR